MRSQRNTQKRRGHFVCGVREHSRRFRLRADADGHIFDISTLSITGSMTGGGTVVVESGGALDCGGIITADLSFAGSNVTVTLGTPTKYHGSLNEFGRGDTLILQGDIGSAASVINSDTLFVTTGGSSVALAPAARD